MHTKITEWHYCLLIGTLLLCLPLQAQQHHAYRQAQPSTRLSKQLQPIRKNATKAHSLNNLNQRFDSTAYFAGALRTLAQLQQLAEQGAYRQLLQQYYAHQQLSAAEQLGPADRCTLYELLSTSQAQLGDYTAAIQLKDSLIHYQKSNLDRQKTSALAALAEQYPIDKARAQRRKLKLQRVQQALATNRQQQRLLVIIAATILLLAIVGFLTALRARQKRHQKQLEKAVAEHKQILREKNQQLQMYNKELQAFFRSTSHDLVEPLRNISSFSGLLERYYQQQHQQARAQAARELRETANKMHQLVVRLPKLLGVNH